LDQWNHIETERIEREVLGKRKRVFGCEHADTETMSTTALRSVVFQSRDAERIRCLLCKCSSMSIDCYCVLLLLLNEYLKGAPLDAHNVVSAASLPLSLREKSRANVFDVLLPE
jgi:hypothetical protein